MNMIMILMLVFFGLALISAVVTNVVNDDGKMFFIGCLIAFGTVAITFLSIESCRENEFGKYVIVKSIHSEKGKCRYTTNYPAFEFLSDSLIYKPDDTVWLGVKK